MSYKFRPLVLSSFGSSNRVLVHEKTQKTHVLMDALESITFGCAPEADCNVLNLPAGCPLTHLLGFYPIVYGFC